MILDRFKKTIAVFLLCVLSVYTVPREFLHAVYGHEDTSHCNRPADPSCPLGIDTQHTHCDILNFETDIYSMPEASNAFCLVEIAFRYNPIPVNGEERTISSCISPRAPPRHC